MSDEEDSDDVQPDDESSTGEEREKAAVEADEIAEESSDDVQPDDESSTEDEHEEADEAAEAADDEPPAEPRKKKKKKKKRKKRSRPVASDAPPPLAPRPPPPISMLGFGLALVTLCGGAAAGWFLHKSRSATVDVSADASAAGSAGPCGNWQSQICTSAGEESAACAQAKAASEIMPDTACAAAIPEVVQTLATIKEKRAACDKLETKLCEDLGAESDQCKMVKSKTSSIPTAKCQELFDNYDKVLASLKQGPGGRPGGPPGMRPGGPPGMRPGGPPGMRPGAPAGGPPQIQVKPVAPKP